MIPVDQVVSFLEKDMEGRTPPVCAYWYEVDRGRKEAVAKLEEAKASVCIVALRPQGGFENANALPSDVVELLERERLRIEASVSQAGIAGRGIALVLVSRTRLKEPLIGSPTVMPSWFPYCGGRLIDLDILDVVADAAATLFAFRDEIAPLQTLLFELEGLMLLKMEAAREQDHNACSQFLSYVSREGETPKEFLRLASERHASFTPEGFRVVASPTSASMLGRIVGVAGGLGPAKLPGFGQALFGALGLSAVDAIHVKEPLVAVALRSTIKEFEVNSALRAMRNVVVGLYCSSQLITAMSHAAEYGRFEYIIVRSVIGDLVRTMSSFKGILLRG